jgi:hypothetical protein
MRPEFRFSVLGVLLAALSRRRSGSGFDLRFSNLAILLLVLVPWRGEVQWRRFVLEMIH